MPLGIPLTLDRLGVIPCQLQNEIDLPLENRAILLLANESNSLSEVLCSSSELLTLLDTELTVTDNFCSQINKISHEQMTHFLLHC